MSKKDKDHDHANVAVVMAIIINHHHRHHLHHHRRRRHQLKNPEPGLQEQEIEQPVYLLLVYNSTWITIGVIAGLAGATHIAHPEDHEHSEAVEPDGKGRKADHAWNKRRANLRCFCETGSTILIVQRSSPKPSYSTRIPSTEGRRGCRRSLELTSSYMPTPRHSYSPRGFLNTGGCEVGESMILRSPTRTCQTYTAYHTCIHLPLKSCLYKTKLHIYIYIYIYIERERESNIATYV